MKNLSVRRLQEAVESEYGGHVTIRSFDARVILCLLGASSDPDPEGALAEDLADDWVDDGVR